MTSTTNGLHSIFAMVLLAAALTHPALAADDDLAERIAACTHERDDTRRLACFDRAAVPNAPAPNVDAQQAFGVHGSELARSRDDGDVRSQAPPKRMAATVTAIDKRPRGELVFTLDNGQVWAQKEAGTYFPVKVGDPVSILAGTLGSFRLVVANRATPVTRME
jgi:hypothetical protein